MSQCARGLKANREGGVNKSVKVQLLGCQSVDVSVCVCLYLCFGFKVLELNQSCVSLQAEKKDKEKQVGLLVVCDHLSFTSCSTP